MSFSEVSPSSGAALDAPNRSADEGPSQTGESIEGFPRSTTALARFAFLLEAAFLLAVFACYAGTLPPDVNEAHYLGKAKHFWMPDWCAGDLFLHSSNAHWLFYVTVGGLNLWFDLATVAWLGRLSSWLLIALGWCYFCRSLTQRWGVAWVSGLVFLLLQHFGHLAGEWIIGGVEAKGFAFGFVFFGLGRMVRGDWVTCWIWWGLACAFHVLVGGWVVVAAMMAWMGGGWRDQRLLPTAVGLILGGLLSLLGVIPGLLLGAGVEGGDWIEAQRVYVFERLQHHLVFSSFSGERLARFSGLVCLWMIGTGAVERSSSQSRILRFTLGTVVIAVVGVGIDHYVRSTGDLVLGAKYLRFYWFRSSDIFVPAAAAVGLTAGFWEMQIKHAAPVRLVSIAVSALILGLGLIHASAEYRGDGRPRADQQSLMGDMTREGTQQIYHDWQVACRWVDANLPEDARVFSPRRQQTFKWYAQRAEVANWKDIPQDAAGLVRWRERFEDVYGVSHLENQQRGLDLGLLIRNDAALVELSRHYGADYLMVTRYQWVWRQQLKPASRLSLIFPPADADPQTEENYFVILKIR